MVDTQVLVQGNDFFETRFIRALTEEGGRRILRLPRIKTQVFKAYLQWAYSRRVVVMDSERARESPSRTGEQIRLANLFEFAYRITDVALQNAVTDAFLDTLRNATAPIAAATIDHLWGESEDEDDDTLRNIVMQWFMAKEGTARYLKMREHEIPVEFFVEMAFMYCAAPIDNRAPEPYDYDPCVWHKHTDAVPSCKFVHQRRQLTQESLRSVGNDVQDVTNTEIERKGSSGSVTFGRGTPSEIEALGMFS